MNALLKNYPAVRSDDLLAYRNGLRADFVNKITRANELLAYNARAGRTPPPRSPSVLGGLRGPRLGHPHHERRAPQHGDGAHRRGSTGARTVNLKITRTVDVEVEINLREELAALPDDEFGDIASERGYIPAGQIIDPGELCHDDCSADPELAERAYHELRGGTIGPHTRDLLDQLIGRIL